MKPIRRAVVISAGLSRGTPRRREALWRSGVALAFALLSFANTLAAQDKLLISEIMYHPVERPAFDTNGAPLLDISDDVHEFLELHNAGTNAVSLDGWQLSGGISFDFPTGISVPTGAFVVIAKNPARLAAIAQYGLTTNQLLGPYSGHLRNSDDTIRLQNAADDVVDSVSYSASFPWAISANALGAEDEWAGLNSSNYQYRGRSLERLSFSHPANDPANWLASPLATGPTPRRTNSIQLAAPKPIVVTFSVVQASDGATIIRANQSVRLDVTFSSTNELANVSVEYFIDDINLTNEVRSTIPLTALTNPSDGRYSGTLPGRPDRSVVRYRIRVERDGGTPTVSPRADDPFAWHAYFVAPVRAAGNPIYDVFISSASLSSLNTNISQSPRRITLPDPPGNPRESWNATQPAILIYNGEVFDIQMRHHGSRYNRGAGRNSFKWQFPRYHRFYGERESVFITDKGEEHRVGAQLYDAADFPAWRCRYVNLYLNGNGALQRLEQEEVDETLYRRWADEQSARYPGRPVENLGGMFKATGVIPFETGTGQGTATYFNSGEGPYYIGNSTLPPAKPGWSVRQRCEWTYGPQINGWKGGGDVEELLVGLWAARGDSPIAPNPNLATLRPFLAANFDVDRTLTYMAIRDWSGPFDNATHNYFLWSRDGGTNGRWSMIAWDLDSEFDNPPQTIFWDEFANPQPDILRGPHWIKDSFYKAYRNEYKQKLWLVNNTLLHPTNFVLNGWTALQGFANARVTSVNQQLALGIFQRPLTPTNLAPANGSAAFPPAALVASTYLHSDASIPAHANTTWLIRRANGGYTNPVLRVTTTTNLTSLPIPFDALVFGQSYFWKCFYTDTNGHPSWNSTETSFVFGGNAAPGVVMLNEILADNRGSVTNGGEFPDFIELVNTTDQPQDLGAFSLTDNALNPGKFFFPPGTIVPPRDYLTLWCDDETNAPGLHTGFALDNDGQTVALFAITTNGYALADSVRFGLQIEDHSIGRVGSNWLLNVPTPNVTNVTAALGPVTSLRVNEWLASASSGPDWFELFNPEPLPVTLGGLYLSDNLANVTNTRVAALSFIAARGFRQFIADEDETQSARHTDFRLSAGGESILLTATNLVRIDAVTFGAQTTDVSQGRLLDGSTNIVSFPGTASPEAPNFLPLATVFINEVLSHSDPPFEDAIELLNISGSPVNIGGWWLSDNLDNLQKFRIPTNSPALMAGGFAVFTESQFGETNSPTAFALSSAQGDEVYLSATDGAGNLTGQRASVRFGAAVTGVSFGRVVTSVGVDFWAQTSRTLSNANAGPLVGPIVISEIQYHPPSVPGDDDDYEYIKLRCIAATNVALFDPARPTNTWRLRDSVDFNFPTNVVLPPSGSLLVVGFDPAMNPVMLTDFRSLYGLDETVVILGPYQGRLDNAGDSVELLKPDPPVSLPGPDFGFLPHVLVDRVRYFDAPPWPTAADGTGQSLQRVNLAAYGNEPTNWIAGPSLVNNVRPTIAIISPTNGTAFGIGQPLPITVNATDSDGFVRRVEFFANDIKIGEATNSPFSFTWSNALLGSHQLMARAIDDRLGVTDSAPVFIGVINLAPTVGLVSPTNGASFVLPTNIVLEATAGDSDGTVARVDFYANGFFVGSASAPPYSFNWINVPSGTHQLVANAVDNLGALNSSSAVTISAFREVPIAYVVEAGTVGLQDVGTGLGMDFDVLTNIVVTHLGVFDSGTNGINGSATLTAQLYTRSGNSGALLATLTFSSAAPGTLAGGSRFKPLSTPLALNPGSYTIASYGHDTANPNGNIDRQAKTWSTDDGGGMLSFVGTSRYGSGGVGNFPPTADGGPVDRYAAGTFQFRTVPDVPAILVQPASNMMLRANGNTNISVGVIGRAPLRYQWTFNGTNLPSGTNATLLITNATLAQQGVYQVVVTNAFGAVTSTLANLVLLIDPLIVQQPLSQTIVAGATVTLSVGVTNTANLPVAFRWRRNGVFFLTNAVNARADFVTITNVQAPFTNYQVTVTNAARPAGIASATAFLTIVADTDGDNIPDSWEADYGFGTNNIADGADDSDGDSMLNWEEYVAGTNPTNALSYLKIETLAAGFGAVINFMAVSNRTYAVQFTDALGSSPWQKLVDVVARATNRIEVVPDPAYTPPRFYRLITPKEP